MSLLRFAVASHALRWLAPCLLLAAAALHAQPVEFFSPQGEVKGVRQVTARFAKPMVAFGDPREVDPFTIDCPEQGTGRWADTSNWVYDFARDLPAGVRCTFTLKTGLTDVDGTRLPPASASRFPPADRRSCAACRTKAAASTRTRCSSSASMRRSSRRRSPRTRIASRPASTRRSACASSRASERKTILDNRKSFAVELPARPVRSTPDEGRTRGLLLPAADHRQRPRQVPAPARRARFAAGDARVRAHAAAAPK